MFPSLAAYGGTSGLLGLRVPDLGGTQTVGTLNRGFQRHIDTCPIDYAALMREPMSGSPDTPIATPVDGPPDITVALIGGGIANIIAAYELSRAGVLCRVFEATGRLGGRLRSYRESTTSTQYSEAGAIRFPPGGLMWHYVAQWVRAQGFDPATTPFTAAPFPSPGTVPTLLTYQGHSYTCGPRPFELPPVLHEARGLFADFVSGLNDGSRDPYTIYFADAVEALKAEPDGDTTELLRLFWLAMIEQFGGRSFAEVLGTQVFAHGSNLPDLMAAFGTMGVGTGGFGPAYEGAFLEVLRVLLWDSPGEFMLPEQNTYPDLYGPDEGGTEGFAMGLARAAVVEAQRFRPSVTFDSMFWLDSPVRELTSNPDVGLELRVRDEIFQADFAIVAMTTPAMQHLELDLPYPLNPLLPPPLSSDLVRPSCQAAIKRLDVLSSCRMNTELPAPRINSDWPLNADGDKILCFVTDARPRLAYVLPEVPPKRGMARATVIETYGSDAEKFLPWHEETRKTAAVWSFTYGLQPSGAGGNGAAIELALALAQHVVHNILWNSQQYVQGAFKLDKPEDDYFSSSLFYHYQLAHPANAGNGTDVFLAGDSVGHLGGWVEGAAMSAINAVVGVCSEIEQSQPGVLHLEDRFAALLSDDVRLFHRWRSISGLAPDPAGLSSMLRLGNWQNDPGLPATWAYQGKLSNAAFDRLTVSGPGDFMVARTDAEQLVFQTQSTSGQWSGMQPIPNTDRFRAGSISVGTEKGNPQAQLMMIDEQNVIRHGTYANGTWSEFAQPWGFFKAKRVALDVEGGNAQVVLVDHSDRLTHGIRFSDGSWSTLAYPGSPQGPGTPFFVQDAAVSCTSLTMDLTTVAVVDEHDKMVHVAIRTSRDWSRWVTLPTPTNPDGDQPLLAVSVRVLVLGGKNDAQIVARFTDGDWRTPDRLYSSARDIAADPTGQTWTRFKPVPYPLGGGAGPIVDFAPSLPPSSATAPDWPDLTTILYAQLGGPRHRPAPGERGSSAAGRADARPPS